MRSISAVLDSNPICVAVCAYLSAFAHCCAHCDTGPTDRPEKAWAECERLALGRLVSLICIAQLMDAQRYANGGVSQRTNERSVYFGTLRGGCARAPKSESAAVAAEPPSGRYEAKRRRLVASGLWPAANLPPPPPPLQLHLLSDVRARHYKTSPINIDPSERPIGVCAPSIGRSVAVQAYLIGLDRLGSARLGLNAEGVAERSLRS